MASPPRDFEINGIYHVYNRGYDKRDIFLDDKDYLRFIESLYWFNNKELIVIGDLKNDERRLPGGSTLKKLEARSVKQRKPIVAILALVLMRNHFHLILREINDGGISLFMKKLGNGYTGYFNEKYNRSGMGGIFQGRYRSVKIKTNEQLIVIFSYVHTNPEELVESDWKELIVKNKNNALNFLERYRWSSYCYYIGNSNFPLVTERDFYLNLFGGESSCRRIVEEWINFKAENNIIRADTF